MKKNSTSWKNVRDRHDFVGGTIEIFHQAFPGYPGNPEHWESRYYRAVIERVLWQKGRPVFFLKNVRKFDRSNYRWIRPRIHFGRPLKTYRKAGDFSFSQVVSPQLGKNGGIVYEQPFGECRLFPPTVAVPLFPDYAYERLLSDLRTAIREGRFKIAVRG